MSSILVPDGLVGYWPLDADNVNFATGVVTDLSLNGNNGTLNGGWTSGDLVSGPNPWNDGALNFDGNSNITANVYPQLAALSLCFWVNAPTPSAAVSNVMGAISNGGDDVFGWGFIWNFPSNPTLTQLFLLEGSSDGYGIQADFSFSENQWYFIECKWDGLVVSVYVDTVLCGTAAAVDTPLVAMGTFGIGGFNVFSRVFFVGKLSGVRIYDRMITPDEDGILFRGGPASPLTGPTLPRPIPGSNALGIFKIGVSPIGTIPQFDFWSTVMAQYANSPILTGLIQNMWEYIDPTQWFDEFWSIVMNLPTAAGFGLDVLGRLVGVGRVLQLGTGTYFGFAEALPGPLPFNVGTFFSGGAATTNFALADGPYRVLILAKALANISDGSMRSINAILSTIFRGRGNAYCTNGQDTGAPMTMTLTFNFTLTAVELAIIEQSGAIPIPVGVSFTVVQT